ncbi:unnamed protein product [Phytophthora lilii]|uniref:Unnamed protein product n=1 Tax=Phytophthora lilii TaxID=2077276 RepID=A0A9W6TB23_9STRA|nr:unnamed protein product [Phytophthora lilii]
MRGAARRGGGAGAGRDGGNGRHKTATDGSSDAKTSLVDEWRAHEEDCAARVLQNQFRAFLSRQRMARLLISVYEKHYDPIRKQHFYVNTLTNEATWDKPLLLVRFLPGDQSIARGRVDLAPREAAQRIQRVVRAFLAKKTIRQLVRETYMKLFDSESRVFYYLNTRTGERSEQKPPFFRRRPGTAGAIASKRTSTRNFYDDDDDLEIEPFYFRKAVCKISSDGNPYGSGVIGRFCGILCVLADGKTLADESTARSARVVCNYADERVAFPVILSAETFFAGIKMPGDSARLQPLNAHPQPQSPKKKSHKLHFDFALCALNEDQFLIAAGANIQPLRFEMNDRKLGCGESESLRLGDHIEVVGHPHGKLQVLHQRHLAKLVPNSINPQHLQYDRVMETGAAGCGVFTRGGKLIGIHQFAGAKELPPLSCWYIKPILDTALTLVTWRLRFCTTVKEAIKRMREQQADPQTQFRSVQWIYSQLEKREEADRVEWENQTDGIRGDRGKPGVSNQLKLEQELLECGGLDVLIKSMLWFPEEKVNIIIILRLILKLMRLRKNAQRLMTEIARLDVLCDLLRSHTMDTETKQTIDDSGEAKNKPAPELQIALLCLELLGAILSGNEPAKRVLEACSGVRLVLSLLERELYRHEAAIVGECCFILAVYSFENGKNVKKDIADANGFALLQRVLLDHTQESRILYWASATIGNVACGHNDATTRPQLEAEITSLGLVDSVCECRVNFLSRLHELELSLVTAQTRLDHLLAIYVGEETRNELDACTHLVETLKTVIADWLSNDVAEAADYALRYLLTEEQRRVQFASKRLMRKFLLRKLSMAIEKWSDVTIYERHRAIFLMFINTVRTRQLRPAFRRWEQTTREMRKHRSLLQSIGSGLAIDLTKKKKERYRMLVLQK